MRINSGFFRATAGAMVLLCFPGALRVEASVWTNLVGGNASGYWGAAANWNPNTVPNGTDAVADFSALAISADSTITNDSPRVVGRLLFNAPTPSDKTWTVDGSTNKQLTLATSTGQPVLNVTNVQAIFGGFNGTNGFVKNGNGALAIYGQNYSNTLTGPIVVNGGLLGTVNSGAFKYITGPITVASGASFQANASFGSTEFANTIYLSGTGATPSGYVANAATPDGTYNGAPPSFGALDLHGNATYSGTINLNADSLITHGYNVAVITGPIVASGAGKNLELAITVGGQYPIYANGSINLGSGALTVSSVSGGGSGQGYAVSLAGSNTLNGVTVLTNATVYFDSTNAIGGSGSLVTINAGGAATLNGNNLSPLLAKVATNSSGAIVLNGVSSSTALNFTNYPGLSLGSIGNSTYSGTLTLGGGNYRLGGGGGILTVSSALNNGSAGLVVSGNTADSTVVLTGTHTFGGAILITGGTLMATGTFSGPLVVQAGGALSPGLTTGIGTLTVSNAVNFGGTAIFSINRTNIQNADRLVANSLVLAGTLTVTNNGAAPVLGDSFQLFSIAGTFSNAQPVLNLPPLSGGLMWDMNWLTVDGTIKVAQLTNVVGQTNWPSLLAQEIQSAYSAGYSNVTINPGTYVMANGATTAFVFNGWTNFTINASNTLFVVDQGSPGGASCFELNNCTNVTVSGATVRPKVFPFSQGRVTAIGTNNGVLYCNWQISAGYPTNINWWFNAVSATNQLVNLTQGDLYYQGFYGTNASGLPNNAVYLGNQTWQLNFPGWLTSFSFQTNDWLVARALAGQGFAYLLLGSTNCTLQGCDSQSAGFATYREHLGGGNHMLGCKIQTSPVAPPGGTELPVVSSHGDGVHTSSTYPGLDVENCVFTGVFLDDNIAIQGFFVKVTSASGNTVTFDGPGMFAVGDPVRISSTNGPYFAQANCTAILNLGNGQYQLTLDQSLSVPSGTAGTNPKFNGSGYKILNCQLGNVRSRAIICKGDNGLISGNTIQNALSAIQLGPETYWGEGDYVWNVTITNNSILHCGSVGINLVAEGAVGNRNILIRNNYFQDTIMGDDINLNGCSGVTIDGNVFINPSAGHNPVYLSDSTNIVLLKNLVTNNAAGVSFIRQGSGVTNLQNQLNGIFLAGVPHTLVNRLGNLVLADPAAGGAGTQVVQQTSATNDTEHWVLSPVGGGYCALRCVTNGLVLGVNGSTTSNAPVAMETYTGADSQLWALAPVTNSFVALTNKLSGMAVHCQSSTAGQGLVQRPFNGSTNQQWNLLAAPFGLTATLGTGVTLSWMAYTGATNYTVKRATSANGPYAIIGSGLVTTNFTDTNVVGGLTYYYVVSASLNGVPTADSAATSVYNSAMTWDSDGISANGVTDGSGTWDGASLRWFGSTSVPDTNWPGALAVAVFGSTGTGTVSVSGTQSFSGLIFNTAYTLAGGTLAISTNGPLTVNNNADVTIASLLTGNQSLTKTGTGTLTLSNANNYSGGTTISQGKVTMGADNALGTGSVVVQSGTGNPTVLLDLNGHTLTNPIAQAGGDCYVYNSSSNAATLSGSISFGSYARIGIYSQTTPGVGDINLSGTLIGGWYDKQGAGVLTLSSTNTYTGNTYVTGGAIRAQDGAGITIANLQLAGGVFETTGTNFIRPLGASSGQVQLTGGSSGFSAYGAPVTVALGGLASPTPLVWGTAYFNPSALVLNYNSATTNLTLANAIDLNGTNRTINVNAAVAHVNGAISSTSGAPALTKGGAGTLNLNAANTYGGATFITNGTLGGTGSLSGPLTIQNGAALKPGAGIGTFTVSNAVTLGGSVVMELNQANFPNCDRLMATTIACGGALVVTNLGPALTNRASFQIFSGTLTGAFSSTNLPPLGPNLIWSNSLAANGRLTVLSTAATNRTNITFQLLSGGATLQISWPADHIGCLLQSQTNSLASSNWVTVADSALTNHFLQTIGLTNVSVFFRLVSP